MKKNNFFLVNILFLLLFINCSNSNNEPPGRITGRINFNITEKIITYEKQFVSFSADRNDFWVSSINEIFDSQIIRSEYFTYFNKFKKFEGEWYIIYLDENILNVELLENKWGRDRKILLTVLAGEASKQLTIIQTTKK